MKVAEIDINFACNHCGVQLPLRVSENDEKEEWWNCCSCGATHRDVFDENSRATIRDNVSSSEAAKASFPLVDENEQIVLQGTLLKEGEQFQATTSQNSCNGAFGMFSIVDENGQIVFEGNMQDVEDWMDFQENNGKGIFCVIIS